MDQPGLSLPIYVTEDLNNRSTPDEQAPAQCAVSEVSIDSDGMWVYVDLSEAWADERARIVWWLRSAADGPGRVNESAEYLQAIEDMAEAIEDHPERFAQAPTGRRVS